MTEREAFLRAIRANPDDDLVRLVFADWLDEQGEHEPAEFIRVQCELEPIRHRLEDRRTQELIRREEDLESHRFGTAFEFDAQLMHPEGIGYRRGLPDWLVVSLDTLLSRGPNLLAAYPTIRELAVFDIEGRGPDLAACPLLAGLDVLEVADALSSVDAVALATSPHIRSISQFKLYDTWDDHCGLGARLAERSTPEWPQRIEMIWFIDGLAIGLDAADCDRPLHEDEGWARPINVAAGRELAHDIRPATRLFPLRGSPFDTVDDGSLGIDLGYGMYVGQLPGGIQALFACGWEEWYLVTFEATGIVKSLDRRSCPIPGATWESGPEIEEAARRWAVETLRLTPAVIRVREFQGANRFGIHQWPDEFVSYFDSHPRSGQIPNYLWRQRGGIITRWLRKQDFVIDCGNNYWADWKGTIHSS
jgi:uncharacterized protein (TIGR02996 family)